VFGEKSTVIIDGNHFNPNRIELEHSRRAHTAVRASVVNAEYAMQPGFTDVTIRMRLPAGDSESFIEWFNGDKKDLGAEVPPEIRNYSVEDLLSYVNAMIEARGGEDSEG